MSPQRAIGALAVVLVVLLTITCGSAGAAVNVGVSWPESFETLPVMSRDVLSEHDGSDPDRLIYMAIKGFVFDVSSGGRFYSQGSAYNTLVGKDSSQAVGRMSLDAAHVNDDISSLSEDQLRSLDDVFQSTYMAKYPVVAQVEGTPFRDQRGHDARGMADRRAAEL